MSISQKELKDKLNECGVSITTATLHNYEKVYRVISPAERGAGRGGRWTNYTDVHLIEILVAWCMMNKFNNKVSLFFAKNLKNFDNFFEMKFAPEDVYCGRYLNIKKNTEFNQLFKNKYYQELNLGIDAGIENFLTITRIIEDNVEENVLNPDNSGDLYRFLKGCQIEAIKRRYELSSLMWAFLFGLISRILDEKNK